MKPNLLFVSLLMCAGATAQAQSFSWQNAVDGNMDSPAAWNPAGFTPTGAEMSFALDGDYQVGLTGNMSSRLVIARGSSGTVTFNLGSNRLDLSSIFQINQNAAFTSGQIAGGVQIGSAVSGKLFTVSGSNTQLTSTSSAFVGRNSATAAANNNSTVVSGGASFDATALTIGDANMAGFSANNNSLTVSGSGSSLTVSGGVLVGNLAQNANGTAANNNSLTVTDGATATVGSINIARRASGVSNTQARNNRVSVGGGAAQSTMNINGAVHIGTNGGGNVFRVSSNGTVNATGGATNVNNGVGNALIIDGGSYLATGQSVIVYGSSSLSVSNGGTLEASVLDLRAKLETSGKADINLDRLTLSSTSAIEVAITSATDYSQIQILSGTDEFIFNGSFLLSFANGYRAVAGTQFQLFSFSSASGQFTELNLPELSAGLEWDIDTFYRTGTLMIVPEARSYALSLAVLTTLVGLTCLRRRAKRS